jgi:hypothetical protein
MTKKVVGVLCIFRAPLLGGDNVAKASDNLNTQHKSFDIKKWTLSGFGLFFYL